MTTARYRARRAAGLCVSCGSPAASSRDRKQVFCSVHRAKRREWWAGYQAKLPFRGNLQIRQSVERRWSRIALLASGAVSRLHVLDRIGLSLGTVRTSDIAAIFCVSRARIAMWRTGNAASESSRHQVRTAKRKVSSVLPRPTIPLHWEDGFDFVPTVKSTFLFPA